MSFSKSVSIMKYTFLVEENGHCLKLKNENRNRASCFFFFFFFYIYNLHVFKQNVYSHQVLIYLDVPGIPLKNPLQIS